MYSITRQKLSSFRGASSDVEINQTTNDPQTVFYLNPVSTAQVSQPALDAKEGVLTTFYYWATKIERTVQEQFGSRSAAGSHSLQASWDRSAYRVKLIDYTARETPWLNASKAYQSSLPDRKLPGDYHNDKLVYQQAIQELLQAELPEVPSGTWRIIEWYMTETMILSQDKLRKAVRFAVALPLVRDTGHLVNAVLRVITLSFEHKVDDDGGRRVAVGRTLYEAVLHRKILQEQELDKQVLDAGKELVRGATLDFHEEDEEHGDRLVERG